jgi:hypothetical protein
MGDEPPPPPEGRRAARIRCLLLVRARPASPATGATWASTGCALIIRALSDRRWTSGDADGCLDHRTRTNILIYGHVDDTTWVEFGNEGINAPTKGRARLALDGADGTGGADPQTELAGVGVMLGSKFIAARKRVHKWSCHGDTCTKRNDRHRDCNRTYSIARGAARSLRRASLAASGDPLAIRLGSVRVSAERCAWMRHTRLRRNPAGNPASNMRGKTPCFWGG